MTPSRTMVFTNVAEAAERLPSRRIAARLTGCPWHDVKAMLREVGLAADPPAHGARLDPVRQGRPAYHRRDALRGSDQGQGAGVARHRLQHAASVHRRRACCARSRSTAPRPISTPTPPQHHHFFVEGENALLDIPDADVIVGKTPIAARGLRDRPHRRGGPAAPQGPLSLHRICVGSLDARARPGHLSFLTAATAARAPHRLRRSCGCHQLAGQWIRTIAVTGRTRHDHSLVAPLLLAAALVARRQSPRSRRASRTGSSSSPRSPRT